MKLLGFERSRTKYKKYDALVEDRGKVRRVPFGDARYEHYRDTTGKGLWSHKDHNDVNRRRLYRIRHAGEEKRVFSPGYFAMKYLW